VSHRLPAGNEVSKSRAGSWVSHIHGVLTFKGLQIARPLQSMGKWLKSGVKGVELVT
jgi:hypothetical protein